MITPVQYGLNLNNFLNKGQTNKHLFKKVQKIPISIEIVHFLFLLYNSTNLLVLFDGAEQ